MTDADLERLHAETCAERDALEERAALMEHERDELADAVRDERATLRWIARQAGVGDVPLADTPERVILELTTARHLVDLAVTERDEARALIAGRTTPPTREEVAAHRNAHTGGWWLLTVHHGDGTVEPVACRVEDAEGTVLRWIPLGHDLRPCAWPEVTR
jgi:hypothetical protein